MKSTKEMEDALGREGRFVVKRSFDPPGYRAELTIETEDVIGNSLTFRRYGESPSDATESLHLDWFMFRDSLTELGRSIVLPLKSTEPAPY